MYRIELQGVSMAIMKQILDYIFSGEVSIEALKSKAWVLGVVCMSNCFLPVLICRLTTCMCVCLHFTHRSL